MDKIFAFFRKLRVAIKQKFSKIPVADPERGCWNCKHTNKSFDDVPCCWCDNNWEWEPKE